MMRHFVLWGFFVFFDTLNIPLVGQNAIFLFLFLIFQTRFQELFIYKVFFNEIV